MIITNLVNIQKRINKITKIVDIRFHIGFCDVHSAAEMHATILYNINNNKQMCIMITIWCDLSYGRTLNRVFCGNMENMIRFLRVEPALRRDCDGLRKSC